LNRTKLWLLGAIILIVVVFLAYFAALRLWHMRWGATDDEVRMTLPGDQYFAKNVQVSTRALTIRAPAPTVWHWLVQLGQGRGGWYSYDWLENLFEAHMENADRILPELQNLKIGDKISFTRGGEANDVNSAPVVMLEPERMLVIRGGWSLVLRSIDANTTRLIVRYPSENLNDPIAAFTYYTIFEPAHFVMESGMMLGIKAHAEGSRR
jgi:hypothetical protein